MKNLSFILTCAFIIFSNTRQITSQNFILESSGASIELDELLYKSLSFLQKKLINDKFTFEDMIKLGLLMEFIYKKKEQFNEHKMKELSISWQLRQGR